MCADRDRIGHDPRTPAMVGAGAFHALLTQPQLIETLSRYEVGLYRQFEAALGQFWMVRANRAPAPAAEIIDHAEADA